MDTQLDTVMPPRAANPGTPTLPAVAEAHGRPAALALAALGIVYGDIGTSPLYAFKQAAEASGCLRSTAPRRAGPGARCTLAQTSTPGRLSRPR